MLLTILLAKVFGAYMFVGGLALLIRKRFFMSALAAFIEDKASRVLIAAFDLIFGLFIINLHDDWSTLPASLITLIGWMAVIKGVVAMFVSDTTLEAFVKKFREGKWYAIEGVIVLLVGLYLAAYGFGVM